MGDTSATPSTPASASGSGETVHRLEAQRRENRDAVAALGLNPYGLAQAGLVSCAEARRMFDPEADEHEKAHGKEDGFVDRRPVARIAGRVMLLRDNGKLVWLQLRDETASDGGDLQVAVSKRDCDEMGFALAKTADLGDIVVAEGPLTRTKTGEVTVWASRLAPGAKSVAAPPEKWAGLQDVETRYRKRYIDLYANPDTMRTLRLRSMIVANMRRFLRERGFLEVETPMLQTQAGGAAARPFLTHMNALDIPLSLRIAPELYLKRLLVGGMRRVFEIGRNFRNEGLSRRHNPEFTALEAYEAFGDCDSMMELTESLLRELAHFVAVESAPEEVTSGDIDPAHVKLPFGAWMVDYGSPFARVTYGELFEKAMGFPMTDTEKARAAAKERGLKHEGLADAFVINELFEEFGEALIDPARPTFVTKYPSAISPLTRPDPANPDLADRWDLFIGKMEIGPAYTELNDPDVQEAKFREQLGGADEEERAFRTLDEDFIEALKVGMPPAGGLGLGVDRIVMLLTNSDTIRDVIPFPFMRPLNSTEGE
ncbi:MAG: lysine--tRNA ligase [Phycisphaeraceae bacterium]|nr:lysine--tRNA ligase [Phycisphaeraceae bacterium]MCB9847199.1 lysine--tRNA ligase [Phycisphaeraceae bacterium]